MKHCLGAAVTLLLVACTTPRISDTTSSVPAVASSLPTVSSNTVLGGARSVQELAAAVAQDAARTDLEPEAKVREDLAADAGRLADACLAQAPHAASCLYYHAIALGLEARAHPIHAVEVLTAMIEALVSADAADPEYDNAGPSRVRALVLTRAPGWPLGPGDPDAGLAAAKRAVALWPDYPPNVLALAGALAKTGDAQGARKSYAHAWALAQGLPASADREDWLREADTALQR